MTFTVIISYLFNHPAPRAGDTEPEPLRRSAQHNFYHNHAALIIFQDYSKVQGILKQGSKPQTQNPKSVSQAALMGGVRPAGPTDMNAPSEHLKSRSSDEAQTVAACKSHKLASSHP